MHAVDAAKNLPDSQRILVVEQRPSQEIGMIFWGKHLGKYKKPCSGSSKQMLPERSASMDSTVCSLPRRAQRRCSMKKPDKQSLFMLEGEAAYVDGLLQRSFPVFPTYSSMSKTRYLRLRMRTSRMMCSQDVHIAV